MNWLQAIFYILVNIPTIYKLIKDLLDVINGTPQEQTVKAELVQHVQAFKADKDAAGFIDRINSLRQRV